MKTTESTLRANGLSEEQFAFAQANYGLVVKACESYHVPEELYQDCLQAGWETLIRKIPDYDAARAKFSTFIFPWLRNAFNDVIRGNGDGMTYKPRKSTVRMISMDKPVSFDADGNSCSLSDILPDEADSEKTATDRIMNELLGRCICRLDAREQYVLKHYYNLGNCDEREWSLREIAVALNTTRTTVSNVLARAQEKLRCMFEYGTGIRRVA